jgi:NAD+ synthase (glutamine-hydrolysing)
MKVALIQNNPVTGALWDNMKALAEAVWEAEKLGAELCIAPEMSLCGHNVGDLLLRSGFAEDCRKVLDAWAAKLGASPFTPPLMLGAPVTNPAPRGKSLQNCAVLLHNGTVSVVSRKVLLPSEGIHDDTRYFEPGVACGILQYKGWRLAVTIGEDIWNDRAFWQGRRKFSAEDPVEELMNAGGADALINLAALPYEQGLPELHQRMSAHLASRYRVPVVSVNLVGGNDSLVYYGGSLAFDDAGALSARAPAFRESLLLFDLMGKAAPSVAEQLPIEDELWQAVVLGTRDYVRKCGFDGVVLGLSGGVDSALVATIAKEAVGADKVTALLMPSPFSSQGSVDDAALLAKNLGIAAHTLPITPALNAFEQSFNNALQGSFTGLAKENTQARIRGTLLMAYANRFNCLLLATGNKSEGAVGYATLYGDLTGGLDPIGDLYKHQVYALCRRYNALHGDVIPEAILTKAPSAELSPGQKDSDSLPPYEELDPLLHELVDNLESVAHMAQKGHDRKTAEEVARMLQRSEFKRHQAPPGLHLSARGFGGGWRMPIAVGPAGV